MASVNSTDISTGVVPSSKPNGFGSKVQLTKFAMIYDPEYILKFKNPDMATIVDRLNQLAVAVSDLQSVVTNIVTSEGPETRSAIDKVWGYTKSCCDHAEISYPGGSLWDGSGVYQEGIDPWTCHIVINDHK